MKASLTDNIMALWMLKAIPPRRRQAVFNRMRKDLTPAARKKAKEEFNLK